MPWRDGAGRRITVTCRGHVRHWFTVRGFVGLRSPVCVRCSAPNPRPLSEEEQREYDAVMRHRRELSEKRRGDVDGG